MTPLQHYLVDFNARLNLGLMTPYEIMTEMQEVSSSMMQLATLSMATDELRKVNNKAEAVIQSARDLARGVRAELADVP